MYLVFDIGGTVIKYCLMNDQGQISQQWEFSAQEITSLEMFVASIKKIYLEHKNEVA